MPADTDDHPIGEIVFDRRGHVAWITIDQQHRANALTDAMSRGLHEAWRRADDDPEIRVVVVTGAGDRHFCAGGDRTQLASQTLRRDVGDLHRFTSLQAGVRKPVIAAVNGSAAGAGMTIALDADITFATRATTFSDPHTRLGLVVAGGPLAIARAVPFSEVARIGIAGKAMTAERAHQLGVVSELADDAAAVRQLAEEHAEQIARQSPTAVQLSLGLLRRFRRDAGTEAILDDAARTAAAHWDHPDAAEGPRAAAEGRAPEWA